MSIVVIGGGHNGLVAASLLAKRGKKVTLIEKRDVLGGLAAPVEVAPGYVAPGLYQDTSLFRPWVADALELGLKRRPRRAVFFPGQDGDIRLEQDSRDGLSGPVSGADLEGWRAHHDFITKLRPTLMKVFDGAPLSVHDSLWSLLKTAVSIRRLGASTMTELLRVAPMCIADHLRDTFKTEHLMAGLSYGALEGAFTGPWSAHTALLWILREAFSAGEVEGGSAAVVKALEGVAERAGVVVRRGVAVERIIVGREGVQGVQLVGGEVVNAIHVLSTLDPKQTFAKLIGPPHLPLSVADAARVYRMRGTTGIVLLALNGPLTTAGGAEVESLRTGKTLDAVERGFDGAKYRQVADKPALWVETYAAPGPSGPSGAGPGHRVAVVRATALPYDVEGGWTEERRAAALARVVETLAEVCPGVKERLVASRLLTPVDIEREYGISGGHLLHGELAPDQLLSFRPGIEIGRYTTPIAGLFLGGGATHPGLGLTGSAGMLAAKAMLG